MKRINTEKICIFLLGILILLMYITIVYVNLFRFNYRMNADIASDAVLARLIWESKEWVPDSWYVSTEIKVFSMSNLAALVYGITGNMNLSAGISCAILAGGVLVSGFYLVKCLHMSVVKELLFILLCLILPNNFTVVELLYLFAVYYAPHTIALFITLGIYVKALDGKLSLLNVVISILLSIMLGIQGVRGILVISGPLLVVELFRNLYLFYCRKNPGKKDLDLLIWSICLVAAGFLGGLFPGSVEQSFSRNIRKAPEKLLNHVIPNILQGLGFDAAKGMEVVVMIVTLVLLGIMLLFVLYKIRNRIEIEAKEWILIIFAASPIAAAVMLTFTTVESSDRYFFVLFFAMSLSIVLLYEKSNRWLKGIIIAFILGIFILHYNKIYIPIIKSEEPPVNDVRQVVEYLKDKGLKQGYASFGHANTMTVYSNGEIRIAAIDQPAKMNICKWMSSEDWYVPNVPFEKRTAYIITESELEEFQSFLDRYGETVDKEAQIGIYYIFSSDYNYSNLE